MITIIDYGMGNLGSVQNMLKRINVKSRVATAKEEILSAEKIILPGVGAFDAAITRIEELGLRSVLEKKALEDKVPFLGICLGMQLLTNSSEEGVKKGLGFINAETKKFIFEDSELKIPHMGWNRIKINNPCDLTNGFTEDFKFYFVHSYLVKTFDATSSIASTTYGNAFDSMIRNQNVYGAQFHPEKSHKYGMQLFENFSKI